MSLISKILDYSKAFFLLLDFFGHIIWDYAWLVPKKAKVVQNQGDGLAFIKSNTFYLYLQRHCLK